MGVINKNFLNDEQFKNWVATDFPNSGIWDGHSDKSTTEIIKETTVYLSNCQAIVAAAAVINPLETDPT